MQLNAHFMARAAILAAFETLHAEEVEEGDFFLCKMYCQSWEDDGHTSRFLIDPIIRELATSMANAWQMVTAVVPDVPNLPEVGDTTKGGQ